MGGGAEGVDMAVDVNRVGGAATARAPKRLFRIGPLPDPLALSKGAPDGPADDPAFWRALHLAASRRGAFVAVLAAAMREGRWAPAAGAPGAARALAGLGVSDVRCTDPRPFLDARDPAALPPDLAALAADPAPAARRALLERADDLGLAGIAFPDLLAPAQAWFALLDPEAVKPLAPPKPVSPHDPDLAAVARLLAGPSQEGDVLANPTGPLVSPPGATAARAPGNTPRGA